MNDAKSLMLSLPMEELHAFCVIRACYTQSTGLWVTQRQSTIYKICISVEHAMLWKFSRPFLRGRLLFLIDKYHPEERVWFTRLTSVIVSRLPVILHLTFKNILTSTCYNTNDDSAVVRWYN